MTLPARGSRRLRRGTTVTGAAAAARHSCAKAFCAAGPAEPCHHEDAMAIPPELKAQILRFYHAEKWSIGTIARQLKVHHDTVSRVLAQAGLPRLGPPARHSQIDPLSPVHSADLGEVPDPDRGPALRHGARARLRSHLPLNLWIWPANTGKITETMCRWWSGSASGC